MCKNLQHGLNIFLRFLLFAKFNSINDFFFILNEMAGLAEYVR